MIRNRLPNLLSQLWGPMRKSFRGVTNLVDYHSHYDTLEVAPDCTKTEIRESWLRLSMLYHPDLNKGVEKEEAARCFGEVREAYKLLIDEKARSEYDDKIGFKRPDPPPDFHKEWSFKSESTRIKGETYRYLWDEEKIRKLMTSERLREVDWNKQTPAERHQILVEEEQKQKASDELLAQLKTHTLQEGMDSYFLMVAIIITLNFVLQWLKNHNDEEIKEARVVLTDIVTDSGTHVMAGALETPPNPESTRRSFLPVPEGNWFLEGNTKM